MSATSEGFMLDTRLAADTVALTTSDLSELRLMNDAQYPWLILVPQRAGVREIFELSAEDQQRLLRESSVLGEAMMQVFGGRKLNVAALGNAVEQLHLHHIVRFAGDAAWPKPVWGTVPPVAYSVAELEQVRAQLVPVIAAFENTG
jgi:diadenosine tetraphosphate (Ap4A) HIT family hydrolase